MSLQPPFIISWTAECHKGVEPEQRKETSCMKWLVSPTYMHLTSVLTEREKLKGKGRKKEIIRRSSATRSMKNIRILVNVVLFLLRMQTLFFFFKKRSCGCVLCELPMLANESKKRPTQIRKWHDTSRLLIPLTSKRCKTLKSFQCPRIQLQLLMNS